MWVTAVNPFTTKAYDTKIRCWYFRVYPQKNVPQLYDAEHFIKNLKELISSLQPFSCSLPQPVPSAMQYPS